MCNLSVAASPIAGWPENSLFRNHVIKDRVKTQVSGMRPAFVCVASQVPHQRGIQPYRAAWLLLAHWSCPNASLPMTIAAALPILRIGEFHLYALSTPCSLQAGHFSRVDAMRRLLQQALKDPLNDRSVISLGMP